MAGNDLEIVLKLVDEASGKLKTVLGQAEKSGKDAGEKTGKAHEDAEKKILRLTLTIGGLIKAYTLVARNIKEIVDVGRQMDSSFNDSFNKMEISILGLRQSIAQNLMPILKGLTEQIKIAADFWADKFSKGESTGFDKQLEASQTRLADLKNRMMELKASSVGSLFSSSTEERSNLYALITLEENRVKTLQNLVTKQRESSAEQRQNGKNLLDAKNMLDEFNRSQKESELLFITGKVSASDYFRTVNESLDSSIEKNKLLAQDIKMIADLKRQVDDEELTRTRNKVQEQASLMQFFLQEQKIAQQGMASFIVQIGQTMQTGLSGAITNLITGVQTAKEAFQQFGAAMLSTIVNFIAQKVIASVIEKALLAATVAASSAAGAAIAAAWAPAAAMVSLASFGSNAAPAAAGIATVSAIAAALALPRAQGGDDIVTKPTLFLAGENGPERATFSPVGGRNFHGASSINIFIQSAVMDSAQSIQKTAEELGFAVERSLRGARGI